MKSRMKVSILVVIIIIFSLLTISCRGQSDIIVENGEEIKVNPTYGGQISFAMLQPKNLNPILYNDYSSYYLLKLIFQPLINLDENYKPVPSLAREWKYSNEKHNKLIVYLRENVLWHDGEEFTSEDVKFTFDIIKQGQISSPYYSYFKYIESYDIINSYTISINFKEGYEGLLECLSIPILPSHYYNAKLSNNLYKPIGTGPYILQKYKSKEFISLVANNDYWEDRAYIDKVTAIIKQNKSQIKRAYISKSVDTYIGYDNTWKEVIDDNYANVFSFTNPKFDMLVINNENPLLRDSQIKQAIRMAINKEELISEVNYGKLISTDFGLFTESWLYQGKEEYDIEKAIKILKDKGWNDLNKDGILEITQDDNEVNFSFNIVVNKENNLHIKAANNIKQQLKEIGVEVNVLPVSLEERDQLILSKSYDTVLLGVTISYIPELNYIMNFTSFKEDQFIKLMINQSLTADNEEDKLSFYLGFEDYFYDQVPYIGLYFGKSTFLISRRVRNVTPPTDYNLFNNINKWYIEYLE